MKKFWPEDIELKCLICIMLLEKTAAEYFSLLSDNIEDGSFSLVFKYIAQGSQNHYMILKKILESCGENVNEEKISLKDCYRYIGGEGINIINRYNEIISLIKSGHKISKKELYYLIKDEIDIDRISGIDIFTSIMYEIYRNIVYDEELIMIFNLLMIDEKNHINILKEILENLKFSLKENY